MRSLRIQVHTCSAYEADCLPKRNCSPKVRRSSTRTRTWTDSSCNCPLPTHISEQKVIEAIDYRKDVDGFPSHQRGTDGHRAFPVMYPPLPTASSNCSGAIHDRDEQARNASYWAAATSSANPWLPLMMQKAVSRRRHGDRMPQPQPRPGRRSASEADIIIAAVGTTRTLLRRKWSRKALSVIDVGTTRVPDTYQEIRIQA